jgi:microsomal dipeptidase-like Zn-dependent dipeptidase
VGSVAAGAGYAKRELKKIPGENYLRVIREVTGK